MHILRCPAQPQTNRLEVVQRQRKALHFYFYFLDPEFGLLHVRLQSWFPFNIQLYVNGRAWLARQFDREGIEYEQYENTFTRVHDVARANKLCERSPTAAGRGCSIRLRAASIRFCR